MEFYESTSFGIRVATYQYVCKDETVNLKFRLLPMFHIGSKSFYKEIRAYLEGADLIVYEGIRFKSWKLPINNFKITAEKLKLVTQTDSLLLDNLNGKLIHGDFNKQSGKEAWNDLRIFDKIKYNLIFPVWIYFQDKRITRKKLVKYYMRSAIEQDLAYGNYLDQSGTISKFRKNARDKIVLNKIQEVFDLNQNQNLNVAILYGAGHMASISRYLMDELNYKTTGGEFIEVFKT